MRAVLSTICIMLIAHAQCAFAYLQGRAEAVSPLPSRVNLRFVEVDQWRKVFERKVFKRDLNDILVARRAQPTSTSTSTSQTLDLAEWEEETNAKCEGKLQTFHGKASNPAGVAICYNIPYANQKTGVFVADLRLYQITKPEGGWETVGDDIGIGLQYQAAVVTESNFNQNATISESPPGTPVLMRVFSFLGSVKSEYLKTDISSDDFKLLLIPIVTLKGTRKDKSTMKTQLSNNEASFINGQFVSETADIPSPSPVKPPSPLHKIPGKSIAIMPIGMILYSAWMVIGVSIVLYGTYERRKFRRVYRMRVTQGQ